VRDNGSLVVDEWFATAEPSIHAIGDMIDRLQLTPVAIREAVAVIDRLYGSGAANFSYADIPTAVFSQPELATVGPAEQLAVAEYPQLDVYLTEFKPMLATLGGGHGKIVMKLLVDASSDRVVAAHMIGEHAAETIQGLAIAIKAGANKAHFDATVGIHPSAAEEWVTLRAVTRRYRNGVLVN
jgi:glutathione reductase (NADPH)